MNKKEVKPYKSTERDPRVILPRSEFFQLSYEEKRYLMSYWRENFTTNAILKGMGYNNSTSLYKAIKRLGLPTDLRKHKDLMMKEELQQLAKMPEETKEVIKNATKDTVEVKDKEQDVREEAHKEAPAQEQEEVVSTPQVVNKQQEVKTTTSAHNMANLPTIKVELTGDVTLAQIQKVLQFAEEMGLTIKVQG